MKVSMLRKDTLLVPIVLMLTLGLSLYVMPARAMVMTFELDYELSGATSPSGTTPWLTATFDDEDSPGLVKLTMETTNLIGDEYVKVWLFNLDPNLDPTRLNCIYDGTNSSLPETLVDIGFTESAGTTLPSDLNSAFKADGDGYFDIRFGFPESGDVFGAGEVLIYEITGIDTLMASSFNSSSVKGGCAGTHLSAAHIGSIGCNGDDSGWVGANPVPIPAAVSLLGSGLVGLVGLRKKFKK
jgi:hypothetical protein